MGISDIIKDILVDKDMTIAEFAEVLGNKPRTIYNMLYKNSIHYATAERWADALGCDIVFVDRETGEIYK